MERTPLSQNNTKPPTKKVQDEIFAKREKSDVEGEKVSLEIRENPFFFKTPQNFRDLELKVNSDLKSNQVLF